MPELAGLQWMIPPLLICLILTGIHGYLGIHILSRKVIFVDLALAQIAALGTTYAFVLGYDPRAPEDATMVYLFSLGFTFIGAAVFSLTRMRHEKVPQEAFIGITYATASAMAMLVLSKSAGEAEHIKYMLVGNVLLVTWPTILKTALLYVAIGAFHFAFREKFLRISFDPERAEAEGIRVRLWDFLFYLSFGFVITSSVAIAGILLVFSYLVVPAACAVLFAERIGARIAIGWGVGTLCSLIGMVVSYYGDLPTGPVVVACFAGLLALAGALHYVWQSEVPLIALGRLAAGALLVTAILYGTLGLRKGEERHVHPAEFQRLVAALHSPEETLQLEAIHHLAEGRDPHAIPELLSLLKRTRSDRVFEHIVRALPAFRDRSTVPSLLELAQNDLDPFLEVDLAEAILKLKDPRGIPLLIQVLEGAEAVLARKKALELLQKDTGETFGYRPEGPIAENRPALQRWRAWWQSRGNHLVWHELKGRFE